MRSYREQIRTVKVLSDAQCDRCKKHILIDKTHDDGITGARLEFYFSYGSVHDLEKWRYDLCDECCDKLKQWVETNE